MKEILRDLSHYNDQLLRIHSICQSPAQPWRTPIYLLSSNKKKSGNPGIRKIKK